MSFDLEINCNFGSSDDRLRASNAQSFRCSQSILRSRPSIAMASFNPNKFNAYTELPSELSSLHRRLSSVREEWYAHAVPIASAPSVRISFVARLSVCSEMDDEPFEDMASARLLAPSFVMKLPERMLCEGSIQSIGKEIVKQPTTAK